jgi:subtilase family serine protease
MNRSVRSRVFAGAWSALLILFLAPARAQERQTLATHVAAPQGSALIGRLAGSQQLHLAISLQLRNEEQLDTLLQQLYDPTSPNYRHFLSVQQFTDQFGPTVVDYQRVMAFAQSHGLKVTHTFSNRLIVDVSGSAANVEQAFQVRMQVYHHPAENRTFYAPDVEPSVEAGLPILSVDGLSTFSLPHSMLKRADPRATIHGNTTGSGSGGQFLGTDMRAAYGGGTALDGTGQVVGLIELGPYRLPDVLSYFSSLGQPLNVPIVNVVLSADGVCSNTEPPPGPCDDGEEVIDIQQAIAMAPNLSALIVYEAYSSSVQAVDAYNQAASDNLAKQLSISFGWSGTPSSEPSYEQVFKQLEAQGQSSFVASGDAGASLSGGYPGNSPNITDAGGTDLTTNGAGGAWLSESGWIGSGGGWNTQSPIPSYQTAAINSTNGGDPSYRNIPDVAAEANTDNYFCANGSCQGGIGGTSLAAPRWAAFVALVNQQAVANATATSNPTLGFLNPTIYTGNYAAGFHDITTGNNANGTACTVGTLGCLSTGVQGFDAVTGFDLVTGWGSPNGPAVFNALAPPSTNANFSMSATPSVLPLTTAGSGGTSAIAVTALNGFSATTNLSVVIPGAPSSAPAGLTASLSATSIPAGGVPVTLTVGTTSATPGGTYVIAVVGTSGGLIQTAYVTVELPAFVGLTATPAGGLSLNQNGTAAATITITGINGFNGTVNLAASGLPSGVTASFATVNSTTSTVTFSASATAVLTEANKPTPVTITGTATGSTAQTATVNLFVNPPASGGAGTPVDLSTAYDLYAFYDDADEGTITATNSLDGVGYTYSANLLNTGLNFKGTQFNFGPPNQADAVYGTGTTVALPAGNFATLQLLATGIQGNQASKTVTVTYTDSTTSQFTQSFSDWCSSLNGGGCTSTGSNAGESVAIAMPYRDSAGGADNRVFYLYGYSFALNASKTVQSVTLPNTRDVVVLAVSLTPPPPSYSLSAPSTTTPASVNAGSSSTAVVTLTPANSYTGSVTLSCSISPVVTGSAAPSCSFSPNPVPVSAVATATLTFSTVAPPTRAAVHGVAILSAPAQTASVARGGSLLYAAWIVVPGVALIGVGFGSRSSSGRKVLGLSLFCMMSVSLVLLPACGSGSSSGGGGGGGGCSSVPSVPTGLAASSTTSSATSLTWTASTTSSGCSVTGYTVYQNGKSIASATSPTYNVTGLSASTQYSFSVAASDSDGASAQSTAINVTTLSNGTPSGTYTITITGKDASGVAQTGAAAVVTAVVN